MMFKGEVDGVTINALFANDRVEFTSDLLDKKYDSFPALERAIKAKLLAFKKDFTNKQAAHVTRWDKDKAILVEVTSLDGEEYAWITTPRGKREKVRRESLYADLNQVLKVLDNEVIRKQMTEKEWALIPRWEPKK